ncbi:MAG: endolytic transglycosylase MltG [Deinococcales bacterium]
MLSALGVLLVLAAAALFVAYELTPVSATPSQVTFDVKPGWGGKEVAAALERHDLVRNARIFELYLRARGLDRSIGEGLYDLSPSMSAAQIAAALKKGGRPRTVHVVIPEGWRAQRIANALQAAGLGTAQSFLALVKHPGDLRPGFVPAGDSLEGYLFPAGYDIPVRSTPKEVIELMLQRFRQELDASTEQQLRSRGMTVHAWVTLASMVQAEAANTGEMPIIAGVFLNRLDIGMPLQSDPTVAYGLGLPLPQLKAGDLQRDNPWNTYTRAGLPKGPIDSPGNAALQAVLDPVRTDAQGQRYLYFLHAEVGGKMIFRPNTSLQAHNRDVRRYLQGSSR